MDKLPDFMDEKQRKKKIENILQGLRNKNIIKNIGSPKKSRWIKI